MDEISSLTRRTFFAAAGAGAGAVALSALTPDRLTFADELTPTEQANVAVVDAFHKNMSDPSQNLDKVDHLQDTCAGSIIWGTAGGMKLYGLPAVVDWYKNFLQAIPGGLRTLEYQYTETFAKGPVVVEYGLHFVIPPGGPKPAPNNWHCVVHIVRDGKIMERYDNFVRK
jgi:hypothetical protein